MGTGRDLGKFREFLDALASPGGNLLILCAAVTTTGIAAVIVGVGNRNTEVDNFLLSVFSGFTGALLQALTTKQDKTPRDTAVLQSGEKQPKS